MFHIGDSYKRMKVVTTVIASVSIFFLELYFAFVHDSELVRHIELGSMFVILLIMLPFMFKKISADTAFILIAYSALINIVTTTPSDVINYDNAYLTDLIYLFILLPLIGFIGGKYHVIIFAVAIDLYFLYCILYTKNDFLLKNYVVNAIIIMVYSITVFEIKRIIERAVVVTDNMIVEIRDQKEELETQTQHLMETNELMLEQKEQVERMNTTKDKLFSIIAHDIKEPINNIQGLSELLQEQVLDFSEEERRLFVKKIFQSAQNLSDMMDRILNWSKSQLDSFTYSPEKIELCQIYKRVLDYHSEFLRDKGITYQSEVCEHLFVWADINMVEIIFRNLLVNAVKFSHNGGVIRININAQSNYVFTEIIDQGIGMNTQTIERLMNPFDYYTSNGTNKEKGHGLGIKLVIEMIEQNRGHFKIESKEGEGSVFRYGLPVYLEN